MFGKRLGLLWRRVRPAGPAAGPAAQPAVHAGKRPRLLVHAGLHKTGTTSLQSFLASAADELRQRGILYPQSGIYGVAHHNIAWQITRDRRFVSSLGTIEDLANEVAKFDGDVILSSEDFESLLDEPERFAPLRSYPVFREREFIVVMYVRDQGSYVESLYLELLKHGLEQDFMLFLQPVLHDRKLQAREWTFHFDYAGIYARWAACDRANLIVRNCHQLTGDSTITDFCSLVCPDLIEKAAGVTIRANIRGELQSSLLRFYSNRVGRPLTQREEETIQHICEALNGRPVTLPNDLRLAFSQTFGAANKSFCTATGLPEFGLVGMRSAPLVIAPIDRVFSRELHSMIAGDIRNFDVEAFMSSLPP